MTVVPIMWTVWAALVLIVALLFVYRARLSRDEEDQIFLDDSFDHEKNAQAVITAKLEKVQPVLRLTEALAGVATLFVLGYYAMDIVRQFK